MDLDIKADASELVALEYEFDECKHGKQMMVNKLYGKIHVQTADALLPNRGKQSLVPRPEKLVLPVTYFRYQRTSDIRLFNQIQCNCMINCTRICNIATLPKFKDMYIVR